MDGPKFDEFDRDKVIRWVERTFNVTLNPVGNYRKFLQDSTGRKYWIFGGYKQWHGFRRNMLQRSQSGDDDGVLIIAKRYADHIDVYLGPLQPLIAAEPSLTHAESGDLQFNIILDKERLFVHEVPGLLLRKQGGSLEAPHRDVPVTDEVESIVSRLSAAERAELIKRLESVSGS